MIVVYLCVENPRDMMRGMCQSHHIFVALKIKGIEGVYCIPARSVRGKCERRKWQLAQIPKL